MYQVWKINERGVYEKVAEVATPAMAASIQKALEAKGIFVQISKDNKTNIIGDSDMKKFKCNIGDREYIVFAKDAKSASQKAKIADMKTKQGYDVIYLGEYNGKKVAIIRRTNMSWGQDYIVAWGYDTASGTWGQGHYDFRSLQEALNWARKEYKINNWQKLGDEMTCKDDAILPEDVNNIDMPNKITDAPAQGASEQIVFRNRVKPEDLVQSLKKSTTDKSFESVAIGNISEIIADFKADINNSKLDRVKVVAHYKEYRRNAEHWRDQVSSNVRNKLDEMMRVIPA